MLGEKRIERAATLLESGAQTMVEVARQLGVSRAAIYSNGFLRQPQCLVHSRIEQRSFSAQRASFSPLLNSDILPVALLYVQQFDST